ncbi:MAG TPA: tyrosine-type recombinase/integrase [Fimbriimonas sp.]|nr:tyrosine-type recombinase/integrase [Fimbriimonas sp.]
MLRQLADDYVRQRRGSREARSASGIKCALDSFLKWANGERVLYPEDVQTDHISHWLIHASAATHFRTGMPRKTLSIRIEKLRVRKFFRHLAEIGAVAPVIVDAFPIIRTPIRAPGPALKHVQVMKVIRKLPGGSPRLLMLRALVEVAYSAALRPCELLRMDVADFDAEGGLLRVLGKGNKERLVPIGRQASRSLENYVSAIRPLLLIFRNERALWLSWRGRRLGYAGLLALLRDQVRGRHTENITWYSFRRACATELARSGANLWAIKELLGHEHLETLKHYVNFSLDDLKRAHAKCHPRNFSNNCNPA